GRDCLSVEDMPGKKEAVTWGVFPLMGDDALYVRWNGGGGFGDPLDRDAQAVAADVRGGVVSAEAARSVYGVVLTESDAGSGTSVDEDATEALRQAMRVSRISAEAAE
ncbi:MAG: hydantoinase B/oxoprolinase family protein, partial [Alphaproteobacteria bacterium]|nr:hydantoinase B/oxoprolinase family protein [Alphaproteobacteria bacterium]